MVRGKNNGGILGESGDKADTLNLLDSTDSDVEWLNLPPIKGKKPKKKKNLKTQRDSGWSVWGMLKVFLILSMVGAIVLLCVVSVWLTSQLSDVRRQLEQMEGRSVASTDDVEKLFKQMAAVNKTLEQQTKTFNSVISNISTMNKTALQIEGRVDKLGEGLKAAPELKQLPEKLQTVSQTVATMGSDIQNVKETVDKVAPFMKTTTETIDSLKKEFDSIKDQVSSDENVPDRESVKPDLANAIQVLTNQLQTVNSTVSTQLSVLMKSVSQQETRIVQLEETTQVLVKNISSISTDHTSISSEHASLSDDFTSEKFKSSVTDIVNDLLTSEGTVPSGSNVDAVMANITKVLNSLKEMREKYGNLDKQTVSVPGESEEGDVKYVTMEMFRTLGDGFEAQVEELNSSFVKLKADVSTMSQILTKQSNTVTNLTHQVEGTRMFLVSLQQKIEQSGAHKPFVSKGPVVESTTASKLTTVIPAELKTTKEEMGNVTVKSPSAAPGTSQTKKGVVSVSWIKTPEDLEQNFRRWDREGNGQVNYNILNGYMGPETPEEKVLEPFDEDGNGLYSLEEFAKAFGMTLPKEEPATESTQPPR